jgi:hypothetical protein
VIVSFQENAWVDARTNIYRLEKRMKPINDWLATECFDGVRIIFQPISLVLLKSIGANIFRTFMTHNTTLLK